MPKIICTHSYRGGTGKSNSTANLAAIVARQGFRVGIVDTDLQSPGIHVLFKLKEEKMEHTLNDFLWGHCSILDAVNDVTATLENQVTKNSKLYLVPSSVKVNDISRILREGFDVELLFDGFQTLIKQLELDYLFLDTHPGLNEETLLSLTLSDIVLIILRPDHQDFQGTAVTVDVARKLKVPKLFLMINKALTQYNFDQLRKQVEKVYELPVVGIIPESPIMLKFASRGIFSLKYPNHAVTQVLEKVAQQIMS